MGLLSMLAVSGIAVWIVNLPVANLHSRPDSGADVVSQAIFGTTIIPAGDTPPETAGNGGWFRVQTPDGYEGWIARAAFAEAEAAYPSAGKAAQVESLFANIYSQPDVTDRQPLTTIPFEAWIEVAAEPDEEEGRWVQLKLPDRRLAWVQRGDLRFDDNPRDIPAVIALARRFTGLPYLWGGTSSFGFDCSGFTQMLYRQRGILIPRDSTPQAQWEGMKPVAREDLAPGDLLFFGASPDKINHTGMYIGGGEFIHATTYLRPVVQISRLDDEHWSSLLVACRHPESESE